MMAMVFNTDSLRKDTVALIRDIDVEIEKIKAQEANEADRLGSRRETDPTPLRLATLLQAKATAYNTLVMLQGGDRTGRSASQRR